MPNSTAIDPNYAILVIIIGVQGLAGFFSSIATIFNVFRRRPPIDQELVNYVRHPELLAAKAELKAEIAENTTRSDKTFGEAFNAIRALQAVLEKQVSDINRSLGRIEGALDTHIKAKE